MCHNTSITFGKLDDEIFSHSSLPAEVSGEIEVVTISIEQNGNDDEGKDDEESSDGGEPPRKQKKIE